MGLLALLYFGWNATALAGEVKRLPERPGDKDELQACERRLCTLVVRKPANGDDLKCALAKTWAREAVKTGAEAAAAMNWTYGDVRCTLPLAVPRGAIVAAVSDGRQTFEVPEQKATCEVAREGGVDTVKVSFAPRIEFKGGEARKVWVNLKSVEGPGGIKAMLWAAANLEDKLGLFHKPLVKEINKFLQKCPEKLARP